MWQAEEKIHRITLPPRKMCPHPNPWNIKMLSHVDEVFEGVIRLRTLRWDHPGLLSPCKTARGSWGREASWRLSGTQGLWAPQKLAALSCHKQSGWWLLPPHGCGGVYSNPWSPYKHQSNQLRTPSTSGQEWTESALSLNSWQLKLDPLRSRWKRR